MPFYLEEEFEDTKGVFRIRKSKNDIQRNDQKKKDLQNIHIKLKIEEHEVHLGLEINFFQHKENFPSCKKYWSV